jgi:hypothetical protein
VVPFGGDIVVLITVLGIAGWETFTPILQGEVMYRLALVEPVRRPAGIRLDRWRNTSNTRRPHEALGGAVPLFGTLLAAT